jgi:hypothetical protein
VGGDIEACNIKGLGLVTNRAAALGAQQPINFVLNLVQFAGVAARAYPLTERVKPNERIADFFDSIVAKIFAASSSNGNEVPIGTILNPKTAKAAASTKRPACATFVWLAGQRAGAPPIRDTFITSNKGDPHLSAHEQLASCAAGSHEN